MMLMANGENEISLEIGALGWFSDKPASMEERGRFFPKAGCSLDLVRFIKQEETLLSSIKVTINQQGIPEALPDSVHPVIRKEIWLSRRSQDLLIQIILMKPISRKG
ncbi:hypothetical protein O5466_16155 [Escherichia coli]|nr:hypothetical protein [Escherichia coli]